MEGSPARAELKEKGVDVSEVFHFEGPLQVYTTQGRAAGRDPQGRSYSSWASFSDPDGNTWAVQQLKVRGEKPRIPHEHRDRFGA